ncbi:DUF5134 domain-containing protein [Nocardia sp. NPDC049707]|uniref:DUF5134 domain-containing protein n=1 Tax=Nocardia sp. NPDC049707 TaxID=3154735 RepID=UPI003435FDD3
MGREVMGVVEFAQEYAALRWSVVVAFLFAATVVLGRLVASDGVGGAEPVRVQAHSPGALACHESDAAHLIMCMVMLAMLVFPMGADPVVLRGVLIALIIVFAALLADRIAQWRNATRALPDDRMIALGYHIAVAAVMLYAMAGHHAGAHVGGPAPGPALSLATLFTADALALIVAASTGRCQRWLGHPIGIRTDSRQSASLVGRALRSAIVPHIVMDLGTAYMLIAAASG